MGIFTRTKTEPAVADERPVPTKQEVHDCISAIVYRGIAEDDYRARGNAGSRALQMTSDYRLVAEVEGAQEAWERLCWIRDHPILGLHEEA